MKKLTAGIFTVMLGLCATSGADAAVASQGYVDTKVAANTQSITELTQTVATNKTAAANATKAVADDLAGYKTTNAAALELKANSADVYTKSEVYTKTEAETKFMDSTEVSTAITNAVTGDEGFLKGYSTTEQMNSAITTAKNAAIQETTNLANGAVATNTAAIATLNGDDQTEGSVAYQVKALEDGAVATNTTAIATLNGDANTAGSVAKKITDEFTKANLGQFATTEAMETALTGYALKTSLKALAYKDTVDTADIVDGAVTAAKLGADAVTDAAVADGALSQGKINGLDTTLAAKMNITNAKTEAGKYVFTANVGDNGVTDYAWELIAREGE